MNTIPEFPKFKNLELSDRESIESFTSKFPPYSDFNFVSMWSWNIKDEIRISQLNENLLMKFPDYITREPFYSFLGKNKINETIKKLLSQSKDENLNLELKLLPEDSIVDIIESEHTIIEDRNNFDYIYSVVDLAELKGSKYETHRNLIHQFLKKYTNWEIRILDLGDTNVKENIVALFTRWIDNKGDSLQEIEYENEFNALKKLLTIENPEVFNLSCLALYVNQAMVGFVVNENIDGKYNMIHFEKANTSFKGCYQFLMQENAKDLLGQNLKYVNFEQDLGITSLRFTKKKFRPITFLKKYLLKG